MSAPRPRLSPATGVGLNAELLSDTEEKTRSCSNLDASSATGGRMVGCVSPAAAEAPTVSAAVGVARASRATAHAWVRRPPPAEGLPPACWTKWCVSAVEEMPLTITETL